MKKTLVAIVSTWLVVSAGAEVWHKPPYRPDENHLPKEEVFIKEAQEETPRKEKEKARHPTPRFQQLDDKRNEKTKSNK